MGTWGQKALGQTAARGEGFPRPRPAPVIYRAANWHPESRHREAALGARDSGVSNSAWCLGAHGLPSPSRVLARGARARGSTWPEANGGLSGTGWSSWWEGPPNRREQAGGSELPVGEEGEGRLSSTVCTAQLWQLLGPWRKGGPGTCPFCPGLTPGATSSAPQPHALVGIGSHSEGHLINYLVISSETPPAAFEPGLSGREGASSLPSRYAGRGRSRRHALALFPEKHHREQGHSGTTRCPGDWHSVCHQWARVWVQHGAAGVCRAWPQLDSFKTLPEKSPKARVSLREGPHRGGKATPSQCTPFLACGTPAHQQVGAAAPGGGGASLGLLPTAPAPAAPALAPLP